MSDGEFTLIERLFRGRGGSPTPFTRLGIGDDASIHRPQAGMELVVSSDASLQGIHWPDDFPPDQAADRAVCAALSDLAAMGAEPLCVWLNVMASDRDALDALGRGAVDALRRHDVELAGGDTTRARENALSITVAGQLPNGGAMRRDRAAPDDALWLLGPVGLAAAGLRQWQGGQPAGAFVHNFSRITPRFDAGMQLRAAGVRCCIDISDGLVQDAAHIAHASDLMIEIELSVVPQWQRLEQAFGTDAARDLIAAGGEDYALLFTAPLDLDLPEPELPGGPAAVRIGRCRPGSGVAVTLHDEPVTIREGGFDHFG